MVVAVGGNALTREGERGTYAEQWHNANRIALSIWRLTRAGRRVILVHGNGPQVGSLSIQQEEGSQFVPPQPLSELVAMTQGALGGLLTLALNNASGGALQAASIVTHVEVAASDPAFQHPSKPIGPFFTADEARQLTEERGWLMKEDSGRGFRRIVASPDPKRILEAEPVRALIDRGVVVLAGGGGGVPVVRRGKRLRAVDAVIDKDFTAARLAASVDADELVFLTGVPQVYLDFGTSRQRAAFELTAHEAQGHLDGGQFGEGSMAPKVRAALRFVASAASTPGQPGQGGPRRSYITSARWMLAAMAGSHGTRIVADPVQSQTGKTPPGQTPARQTPGRQVSSR